MAIPDLTIFFSDEVADWDKYLSNQFENNCLDTTLIVHENLKDISFPVSPNTLRNFSDARVVLIIISPAFLDFLCHNYRNAVEIGKQLHPERTVAMLCGVQESDVSSFHKDALVSYEQWFHLVAKDRDLSTVCNIIERVQNLLTRYKEKEGLLKPGFKFVPRKVQPGNGKVYIILDKPTDEESKKLKIFLEVNGMKEVPVKRRNPYNWHFIIPDNCMQFTNLLKVHVYSEDELIGVSQIKCESKMGELYKLLSATNSPYELMCTTLGMASLYDVDEHLARTFRKLTPYPGLSSLQAGETQLKWKKSKDEFPTLLHFAARYGLIQLTREILRCPGASSACYIKNARDRNPTQLASQFGHNDIVTILTEFQKTLEHPVKNTSLPDIPISPAESSFQHILKCPVLNSSADGYDFPPTNPTPVSNLITAVDKHFGEKEHLKFTDSVAKKNSPHLCEKSCERKIPSNAQDCLKQSSSTDKPEVDFLRSQTKLIEIMEAYKKGASLLEVEKMHNEWKSSCQVSDMEAKHTLDGLRNMYAKVQKSKLNKKQSSTFLELRQFIGSKLRRKDSVSSKVNSDFLQERIISSVENCDSEIVRPMSTLSVTSNTSSSSGSSFDALSCASAGSDSGNHSDNCEDKNHYKHPSHWKLHVNSTDAQRTALLNNKAPAPPPRPTKTYVKPTIALVNNGSSSPNFSTFLSSNVQLKSDTLPHSDVPSSRCRTSVSSDVSDPLDNYDIPPLPRPHKHSQSSNSSFTESLEYDMVPPPLPLGGKPSCAYVSKEAFNQNNQNAQLYDVPMSVSTFLTDYDFPKNIDEVTVNKKSPNDFYAISSNSKQATGRFENSFDYVDRLGQNVTFSWSNSANIDVEKAKSHYCNIFRGSQDLCADKIPDEIAPEPPVIQEPEEEHYKMVGIPVPIGVQD